MAVFAALVAMTLLAEKASAKPDPFYGVVSQTFLSSKEVGKMKKGGVGTLRSVLLWSGANPSRNGDYAWSGFDVLVADAARNGIRVLPFIYGTPQWVARGLDRRKCGACDAYAPRRRAALEAWTEFTGAAVDRYGPGGEFWSEHPQLPRVPIRTWQIWNEQNSKTFYAPQPTVKGYAKLLDAAAGAIRSRDRKADIVLGGMAELAGSRKAIPGHKYLHDLYDRRGAKRDFDGTAIHPYGAKASSVEAQAELFVSQSRDAHDRNVGLWVTETGWGSSTGANPLEVGRSGQAQRLGEVYRWFARERNRLNVKTVVWFSWRDSAASICAWCANSGLLTQSGKPKPAFRMFKRLAK
jgi:hypothetical protein